MLKEMFNKKKEEVVQQRSTAMINPNEVPVQGSVIDAVQPEPMLEEKQEPKITNLIVSSEALEDGTFRYVMVSNMIYSVGPVEIENK
jgi:hypothetical protein